MQLEEIGRSYKDMSYPLLYRCIYVCSFCLLMLGMTFKYDKNTLQCPFLRSRNAFMRQRNKERSILKNHENILRVYL